MPVAYSEKPYKWSPQVVNYYTEDQVDVQPIPSYRASKEKVVEDLRNLISDLYLTEPIIVTFIIEADDGSLTSIRYISGTNAVAREKITNYLSTMGIWQTGYIQGKPVRTLVRIDI